MKNIEKKSAKMSTVLRVKSEVAEELEDKIESLLHGIECNTEELNNLSEDEKGTWREAGYKREIEDDEIKVKIYSKLLDVVYDFD